ncbi:MAG: Beta-1,4-mannooligosaccharide phosphorylase [Verrucomicrobia bacterium ADurb.Bin345]|nr:MAG: Beta-1,4-mannooligosaccharide phosphorylase [Verrucomicrobia bacterium ADurb.Bin345]
MKLKRFERNPILTPIPDSPWESACVCNPAVWHENGRFTLLYRAGPNDDVHPIFLGMAESTDGFTFRRVSEKPVFGPSSDGFDAGCIEDPRLIKLGDTFYLTYAARIAPPGPYWKRTLPLNHYVPDYLKNGQTPNAVKWNLTRSGIAVTRDFRSWIRLGPITDARYDDRDAILFPGQVAGRFAMLHRPAAWTGPQYGCDHASIWLSFSDDLLHWSEEHLLAQPQYEWESEKIGGSTPPIRTERGWLVLYHGVDRSSVYRVGAMMLDLQDPRRILGRAREPILEPEAKCEKEGLVKNVVFPCGNVVVNGTLFVYYGGADTVCCVATCKLDELVDYVLSNPVK